MTVLIADIASYQGSLTLAALREAGFGGINVKVSHGLGQKSVHSRMAEYVREARAAGMALSCFHWLTAGSGVAQADYAYRHMAAAGLNVPGVAHVVDVEDAGVTAGIYADYCARMGQLLGRKIITYTGDWFAAPRPWLKAGEASPWLWSAPRPGYLMSYPGDASRLWDDGYAGWGELAVMQYRVGSISKIDVSQSAVRDPHLWALMTGVSVAVNSVPASTALLAEFNTVGPNRSKASDGTIGDAAHQQSSSDHNPDESGRTPFEDSDNLDEVHARDVTARGPWRAGFTMQRFVNIIVARCKAGRETRLQNIIYNRVIWSRSTDWEPRAYGGSNPHDKHAHFGFRYGSGSGQGNPENVTTPYGLKAAVELAENPPPPPVKEPVMAEWTDVIKVSEQAGEELFAPDKPAGTEVKASTILQVAAIWARRAALTAEENAARLDRIEALLTPAEPTGPPADAS